VDRSLSKNLIKKMEAKKIKYHVRFFADISTDVFKGAKWGEKPIKTS